MDSPPWDDTDPVQPHCDAPASNDTGQHLLVEMWPISDVIPYARNARTITAAAIDKVAASIQEFGWRQPIVVDNKAVIVAGHTRLLAAQKLKLTEVPVHVAASLTPAQVKAYRLMDNRSHDEPKWNYELLAVELGELKDLHVDLELLTGFDLSEIEPIMAAEWTPAVATGDLGGDHTDAPKMLSVFVTPEQKQVVDQAVNKVRDTEDDPSITEGRALELICGDFLGGE